MATSPARVAKHPEILKSGFSYNKQPEDRTRHLYLRPYVPSRNPFNLSLTPLLSSPVLSSLPIWNLCLAPGVKLCGAGDMHCAAWDIWLRYINQIN